MTLLEAGKIINTHGVRGEVKIENYCDDEIFFKKIKTVYIDSVPYNFISKRPHKNFVLAVIENIDTVCKRRKRYYRFWLCRLQRKIPSRFFKRNRRKTFFR